ncbi:TPA: hypothetical protein ACU3VJ_002551 [Enterococcus faecalis]
MSKQELVDKNEVLSIWHNYWESDKLAYEAEDELRELKTIICITELNENQQIVLDWLKERFNETEIKASCTGYLWKLHQSYIDDEADEAGIAYEELSYEEESEVVRVFAEWVIEQGEEK